MRTILVTLAAGLLAFSAAGQNTPRSTTQSGTTQNNWRPVMMTDSTARALKLTPEQQQGWRDRSTQYDRDYRGIQQGATYDKDQQVWWDRRNSDMKKFLTPEQYATWQRMDTRVPARENTGTTPTTQPTPTTPAQPKK